MDSATGMYKRLLQIRHCTLSCVTKDCEPKSAVMQFTTDEDGNILLKMFNDSRKYPILKANPKVSLTFYEKPDYAQVEGTIAELSDTTEAKMLFVRKYEEDEYYRDSRLRFFKVTPKWVRVRLDGKYPPKFKEV